MTWYSPYNTYSNQFQYYHPYSYSSYQSTPYGMMTDASFQNRYHAVDGINSKSARKGGLKILFELLKFGINMATGGSGGGDFGFSDFTGGSASTMIM